jgi:hypothetical protein
MMLGSLIQVIAWNRDGGVWARPPSARPAVAFWA